MSNNPSHTTRSIAYRLPNDVYSIAERRAKKQKIKLSEYLRNFFTKDATRRR